MKVNRQSLRRFNFTQNKLYFFRISFRGEMGIREELAAADFLCNIVFAIDFTESNAENGRESFHGFPLHFLDPNALVANPYQRVMELCARTMEDFDDDHSFPVFGFGDAVTTDKACFSLTPGGEEIEGIDAVVRRYREIVPFVCMRGPTSFAPVIRKAADISRAADSDGRRTFQILVIITDGQVTEPEPTATAIIEACESPISIIAVGVGDGPFDSLEHFDEHIAGRTFDNFHFTRFEAAMSDEEFFQNAFSEVPKQFRECSKMHKLKTKPHKE